MQPVTINNTQYTSTLWASQLLMVLLTLVVLILAWSQNLWLIASLPIIGLVFCINHRIIKNQINLQFKMNSQGQFNLVNKKETNVKHAESIHVDSYWHLPCMLLLKVKLKEQIIYITLFRSVLGASNFSHVLIGLTQLENKNEI